MKHADIIKRKGGKKAKSKPVFSRFIAFKIIEKQKIELSVFLDSGYGILITETGPKKFFKKGT